MCLLQRLLDIVVCEHDARVQHDRARVRRVCAIYVHGERLRLRNVTTLKQKHDALLLPRAGRRRIGQLHRVLRLIQRDTRKRPISLATVCLDGRKMALHLARLRVDVARLRLLSLGAMRTCEQRHERLLCIIWLPNAQLALGHTHDCLPRRTRALQLKRALTVLKRLGVLTHCHVRRAPVQK